MRNIRKRNNKPRLAITLGDPAGIGPEIVARALCEPGWDALCSFSLIGEARLFDRACDLIGQSLDVRIVPVSSLPDKPSLAQRGAYQYQAIAAGVNACLSGETDALVTGPISKDALNAAGYAYPGHTEILGELCDADPVMMLVGGPLRVIPLTTHLALRDVPDRLETDSVVRIGQAVDRALQADFGLAAPRLALTGLNPHAGEGGLFGTEEIEVLSPAVAHLQQRGVNIIGPIPADTAFYRASIGEFDAVLAPTHDQALIPVKLLAFDRCVNVTLNLPIVRVSPGHGTAPQIAWTGQAGATGMRQALLCAIEIANHRNMNG